MLHQHRSGAPQGTEPRGETGLGSRTCEESGLHRHQTHTGTEPVAHALGGGTTPRGNSTHGGRGSQGRGQWRNGVHGELWLNQWVCPTVEQVEVGLLSWWWNRPYGDLGPGDGDKRWTGTRLHGVRGLRGKCGVGGGLRIRGAWPGDGDEWWTGTRLDGGTGSAGEVRIGGGPRVRGAWPTGGRRSGAGTRPSAGGGLRGSVGWGTAPTSELAYGGRGSRGKWGSRGSGGPRWEGSSRGEWGSAGVGSHGNSWRGSGSACRVGPQTLSRGVATDAAE